MTKTNTPKRMHGPGARMAVAEKPKDFKKSWGRLMQYAKKYMPLILIALSCGVLGAFCSLAGPSRLTEITDMITQGLSGDVDLSGIERICLILICIYALGALFNFLQGFIMTTMTQKIAKNLRRDLSVKINRLPLRYFDTTTTGDVLSSITNDVDTIAQSLHQSIAQVISAAALFAGSLLMMLITNIPMALSAVLSTVFGFLLMKVIMGKSQKYFIARQEYLGRINGHIEEVYSGHNIVKVYNGEQEAKEKFDELNDDLYESNWKSQFLSGVMQPLMMFIGNLGYVVVCIVGAVLAYQGTISFGVIVAFMVYIRLFTQPLSQFAQAATSLQSAAAASERVFKFLDEEELPDEHEKTQHLTVKKGDVRFEHVRFGYSPDKIIIKDFSATVKAGQKVAIVGPTGAGKTTLVNLLMRFYEPQSGRILVDGVDIATLTRENVHDIFCMVLQDTWLFEGTIEDNVAYAKEGVTREDVVRACKAVGMDHLIRTLPKGYDTVLGETANLSAGERQLLTIARAMVENAPLLILDEATSSVDTRTELLVQEAMDKLTSGRTSFVIAHRLSTIKNADLILVLKDGDIIESGTHDELLRQKGFYSELYNSQFEEMVG